MIFIHLEYTFFFLQEHQTLNISLAFELLKPYVLICFVLMKKKRVR